MRCPECATYTWRNAASCQNCGASLGGPAPLLEPLPSTVAALAPRIAGRVAPGTAVGGCSLALFLIVAAVLSATVDYGTSTSGWDPVTDGEPAADFAGVADSSTRATGPAGSESYTTGGPSSVASDAEVLSDLPAPVLQGATANSTAAPGIDSTNETVTYEAANLVDGAGDTAWRAEGDATGVTITLRLAERARIRAVGLLPGYAKVDSFDGTDRWIQNRRPTEVEWMFDDGTTVRQYLRSTPSMQEVDVDAASETVRMTIVGVSGPTERDFTAISEVAVR